MARLFMESFRCPRCGSRRPLQNDPDYTVSRYYEDDSGIVKAECIYFLDCADCNARYRKTIEYQRLPQTDRSVLLKSDADRLVEAFNSGLSSYERRRRKPRSISLEDFKEEEQ